MWLMQITALEIQKRNKERVNVYLDGEYAFSLNVIKAAALRKGQELTEAEIAALQGEDSVGQAVDSAARFLAYRPRSTAEVRRNLFEKGMPDAVIDQAVERLEQMGYLDDHAFAKFWMENRQNFKPLSQRALRYELRQKGVSDDIIDGVLGSLEDEKAAYNAAQSQVRRLRNTTPENFRVRLGVFLQRRGFSHHTVHDVINRLIEEIRTEDETYFSETQIEE
jgi:regulatory protein